MPTPHSDKVMQAALADYARNDMRTKDIAKKYDISPSTLTVWADNAGIPLRSRGRRTQDQPTERQLQILEMCETSTYEEVAKHFGMAHKQSIQRMCKRWEGYTKPKKPPFEPGDIIRWKGQRLTVIAASLHTGTLVDKRGRKFFQFRWSQRGYLPKKVGRDERYTIDGQTQAVAA